jgi:hypothetical protein
MTDPSPDDNSENKKVQLETAKIELELKKRELAEKSNRWREISRNPSVVVGLAAVLGSGIFGLITAGFQAHSERAKLQEQVNTSIMIDALSGSPRTNIVDPIQSARKLRMFLDAGLLTDENGAIKRFVDKLNPQ